MEESIIITNIGGTAEVAEVLECPKQQIHALRKRDNFPKPFAEIAASPLWRLSDIQAFKETWKRRAKVEAPTA